MADYIFKPHERPTLPGSPANPEHPNSRRGAYFLIGCLIGITGALGNALVTVKLNYAQGTLGLYTDESAWLTGAYFMTNATANLLLVKYRQQFGLERYIQYSLVTYVITTLMHLFVHDFWTAVAVRAMSGVAASGLTTLTILYFFQSLPPAKRMASIMIGICIPQCATPLARIMSPHLLDWGDWHNLYWLECGLALAALAAVMWQPLPPSEREKAFEPLDFLTFSLLAPGLWLLIAALTEGRIEWWIDRPWIGWALAGSISLIAAAIIIEHRRVNPLINTRWLASPEIVRLMFAAASVRVLLSEQAFGSVGLLNVVGLINDQMVVLNCIIVLASVAGLATAVLTFRPKSLGAPISYAIIMIAFGSLMDADATNLTRPSSFYVSQALIGFASILFLAQAIVIGMSRTLLSGGRNFVSFVVVFALSQNVGGLLGSALLGTFQIARARFHYQELIQQLVATNPIVSARIEGSGRSIAGVIVDPSLRGMESVAMLAQQVTREANILAFNDVFLAVGVAAIILAIWGYFIRWMIWRRAELSPVVLLQQRIQQAQGEK